MAFAIRFLSRPPKHWKWLARGEISFDHEQVSLRGRRYWLFVPGRPETLTLPRAAFDNVARTAALVRCEVRVPEAPDPPLRREETQSLGRQLY